MKYEELVILLPCHSLEDFPLYHEGDDAQGLLANWTALWHPALIAAAGAKPQWRRVDDPPPELAGRLIVVPSVSMSELPTGFAQRAKDSGACVIRRKLHTHEIQQAALAELEGGDRGIDPNLAADFLALGYCYLQVELLTRQLRYSSNLDEVHFQNLVVAAANAACEEEPAAARTKLAACFDLLGQERDHYYPVEAYLLDLTLVAETTLGDSLAREIASGTPTSLLMPAELIETLATTAPHILAHLREALVAGRVSLITAERAELRTQLLSLETCLAELRRGATVVSSHLGQTPLVYGRSRYGLSANVPQVLSQLGYLGALHANFEEGVIPEAAHAKARWEGLDGSSLEALCRMPLDASKPESYLNLAVKLGEAMDSDHVAALALAHWPGAAAVWLDCLRRIAGYTGALGKFITMEQYFRDTDIPSGMERFESRSYRTPYLKQAVIRRIANPISAVVKYWQRRGQLEAIEALETLHASLQTSIDVNTTAATELTELTTRIHADSEQALDSTLDAALEHRLTTAAASLAKALPKRNENASRGYLLFNPVSFVRRVGFEAPELANLHSAERPVYAVGQTQDQRHAVVDLPPMGFLWLPEAKRAPVQKPLPAPLAEENVLRNEFFEAVISPETGSLAALHEYNARSNRISQQISMRLPGIAPQPGATYEGADAGARYSQMRATSVEVTATSNAMGEITAHGELIDDAGTRLAGFTQVYRIWRGSRVLHIEIELDLDDSTLRSDGWKSYVACRFAWANEAAELWRDLHQTRVPFGGRKAEAPHYVEIEDGDTATTVLTGGLPYHCRSGERMLDSLLVVRGETARRFSLGIGVELKQPLLEAMSLTRPVPHILLDAAPPSPADSSWLFQIDVRRVVATHWEPLVEQGKVVGLRVRLLETGGRPAHAKLMAFRPITAAHRRDFQGKQLADCPLVEGAATIDLAPHQWSEFECRWG